ncbi:helix-turn-helix domain-containing protein [Sphingobacterium sp. Mn56C]
MQTVRQREIGVKRTLDSFGITRSTFYRWYQNYLRSGFDGLATSKRSCRR